MLKETIFTIIFVFFMITTCSIQTFAIPNSNKITMSGNQISVTDNYDNGKIDDEYNVDNGKANDAKIIDKKLNKYKEAITFVGGIATITMVAIFMQHCVKLGVLGTEHWVLKRNSIVGLLWSGLAAALLGGMTTFFAISYHLFG